MLCNAHGFGLFHSAAMPHEHCDGEHLSDSDWDLYSMND